MYLFTSVLIMHVCMCVCLCLCVLECLHLPSLEMVAHVAPAESQGALATADVPNICHVKVREVIASDDTRQSVLVASAIR